MGEPDAGGNGLVARFDRLVDELVGAVKSHYGSRLISLAVFGSVARRTPGPVSDLDILVVADPLPHGRIGRVREFERVEAALAGRLD